MSAIYRILLVEDDEEISELTYKYLKGEGYEVVRAYDGKKAVDAFENGTFDVILLDMMLPRLSGKEVMKAVREKSNVPIIIISAKDSELDKVVGLELGADDYITKPFSLNELNARIHVVLRRTNSLKSDESERTSVTRGKLTLDYDKYVLIKDGETITLTSKEFEILRLFFENPKKVFTKQQIFSSVWNDDYLGDDNNVMVHIRRLREKIEDNPSKPEYIKTVWGIGYKLGEMQS